MSTKTACLIDYARTTHDHLAECLETARQMHGRRDDARLERRRIDDLLGATCQHLHVVDEVLLPAYARLPDGHALVHDYTASVKRLEVLLYHVNAHEYGSAIESSFSWSDVWSDVTDAMADQWRHEELLVQRLTDALEDDELIALTDRIRTAEPREPTRPHPFQPHGGVLGRLSRGVMRTADSFWDMAQGRIVPEPKREPKKKPGLLGQYLLGSPRFGEDDDRTQ